MLYHETMVNMIIYASIFPHYLNTLVRFIGVHTSTNFKLVLYEMLLGTFLFLRNIFVL